MIFSFYFILVVVVVFLSIIVFLFQAFFCGPGNKHGEPIPIEKVISSTVNAYLIINLQCIADIYKLTINIYISLKVHKCTTV